MSTENPFARQDSNCQGDNSGCRTVLLVLAALGIIGALRCGAITVSLYYTVRKVAGIELRNDLPERSTQQELLKSVNQSLKSPCHDACGNDEINQFVTEQIELGAGDEHDDCR